MMLYKNSKCNLKKTPTVKITDTDYADDLALISDSILGATAFLHSFEKIAAEIGLYVKSAR